MSKDTLVFKSKHFKWIIGKLPDGTYGIQKWRIPQPKSETTNNE